VQLLVACDVRTRFVDAAEVFGPQKGASPAQVRLLTGRLERVAQIYAHEHGIDVRTIDGSGAAGGLAGGLLALGGRLIPGFDLVADELDLHDAIVATDIVVTGEGFLDEQSFHGKVVGGVQELAVAASKPVGAVVGDVAPEVAERIDHVSLVAEYGIDRAMKEPLWCAEHAAAALLRRLRPPSSS
jgi:glycerate kinase